LFNTEASETLVELNIFSNEVPFDTSQFANGLRFLILDDISFPILLPAKAQLKLVTLPTFQFANGLKSTILAFPARNALIFVTLETFHLRKGSRLCILPEPAKRYEMSVALDIFHPDIPLISVRLLIPSKTERKLEILLTSQFFRPSKFVNALFLEKAPLRLTVSGIFQYSTAGQYSSVK
jgi:hypothetical protein